MNFFKKLFGSDNKKASTEDIKKPENTKLIYLLNIWGEHQSHENYQAVMTEMLEGNSFLLIPSINDNKETNGWETTQAGTTLTFTSVVNLDGLQVLGAFSDENALLEWTKKEEEYTSMPTQDIVDFCKQHNIGRIVINSDQKNMFVLERNRENIRTATIEEDKQVLVGTPLKPLGKQVVDKLIATFKKVDSIEEAYQFAQSMNNETSIFLGIKMTTVSDNSKAALSNAVNNSLENEKLEMPLDVTILETEEWLTTVRNIQNSLFYKR